MSTSADSASPLRLLPGHRVVVVGGASGMGRAVVQLVSRHGADVAVLDLDDADARAAADEAVAANRVRAVGLACDVRVAALVDSAVEAAAAELGGIDALVTVVGGSSRIAPFQPVHEYGVEQWADVFDNNVNYVFRALRVALPRMADQGTGGSIVAISSISGVVSSPMHSAYGAAKAALVNLSRSVAAEYGPVGIRMNVVAPGPVETPGVAAVVDPSAVARIADATPLRRRADVTDIANPVLFFASPMSRHVTGQCLLVDGGLSAVLPFPLPGTSPWSEGSAGSTRRSPAQAG